MAGPIRTDPSGGGIKIYTDSDVANILNGQALSALRLAQGERLEGAAVMLEAICASFGLRIDLAEDRRPPGGR